VGMVPPR